MYKIVHLIYTFAEVILMQNIICTYKITTLNDLKNIKIYVEANNLEKPNFSALARQLNVDSRTIKKYYNGFEKSKTRKKRSQLDDYYNLIKTLLESKQKFYYKSHLYRYLVREHGLSCKQNTFNRYILKNNKFKSYFDNNQSRVSLKIEKPFGYQGQFDWKENISFTFKNGQTIKFDVACFVLSASRFKIWSIYPNKSRVCIKDFFANTFELIGGVPKEIYIDNAKSMVDIPRTKNFKGKINSEFGELAKDYGFEIKLCMSYRPQTKAKVESPMRLVDEILTYNGQLNDYEELQSKIKALLNEANHRICQATNLPPVFLLEKEREHLLSLPQDKICSQYKIKTKLCRVNSNSLINYNQSKYSVPSCFINKKLSIKEIDNKLYIYDNKNLITIHQKSEFKTTCYSKNHSLQLQKIISKDNIEEQTIVNLKELEKFNEQISKATREFRKT